MTRRSLLQGLLAFLAALFGGRFFRRPALEPLLPGFRRLTMPYIVAPGVPIGLIPPPRWTGRIVRQASPLPGQREACCDGCEEDGASFECAYGHWPEGHPIGRTPVHGSPERAYLELMAKEHPHPEYSFSESHILRRLDDNDLRIDDVLIRLVSAEEIDAPGSPYQGGSRDHAFADYVSTFA